MLTLITGMPGNGKTLRAMALIVEEYERNQKAVKAGKEEPRQFFTNITGAALGEFYEVERGKPPVTNPDAFPWLQRIPDHNDWTKLPPGSFVVIDEAHSDGVTPGLERYGKLFPATGTPGESTDPRIRALSTHRSSFSMDIVLMTQWPTKLHHTARSQIGRHIHMNRSMGLAAAGVYTWTRVQLDPYDEKKRESGEEEIWSYPKDLYKRYMSATLHTSAHKFKLPKKIKNGLITGCTLLLMFVGFWKWAGWDLGVFFGGAGEAHTEATEGSPGPPATNWFKPNTNTSDEVVLLQGTGIHTVLNTEPAPTLMGCVSSDRGCRCFNTDGYQIDLTQQQCQDVLSRPLPFNVAHKYQRGTKEREREGDTSISPSEPVSGFTGGSVGTVGAPGVDPTFGTITRPMP